MSSTIWTECGGRASVRPLRVRAWRVVEAQHAFSTLKLVDSIAEQDLLETLIDHAKPPRPLAPAFTHLHYLLYTPFRYPPLRHGSRFGTRHERGLWYGAERVRTALAEKAYYTLLLLDGTAAAIECVEKHYSAFQVALRTRHGVDLCDGPFARFRHEISSPSRYDASQALGRAMRDDGVEAFRYFSARDLQQGANVGVLAPQAFSKRGPRAAFESWHCTATRMHVHFRRTLGIGVSRGMAFAREGFLVNGGLPAPAV